MNGGTCVDGKCSDAACAVQWNCECLTGFAGDLCSLNIDECASFPCERNSDCVDSVDSYFCICAVDCADNVVAFEGSLAEVKKVPGGLAKLQAQFVAIMCKVAELADCSRIIISGIEDGSIVFKFSFSPPKDCPCLVKGGNYDTCKGKCGGVKHVADIVADIQKKIEANNGSLLSSNTTIKIGDLVLGTDGTVSIPKCAPGYRGHSCGIDINECLSIPCLNGASCYDSTTNYNTNNSQLVRHGGFDSVFFHSEYGKGSKGHKTIVKGDSYKCHCPPGFGG